MIDLAFRLVNGWENFEKDWQEMINFLTNQNIMTTETSKKSWLYDDENNKFLPKKGIILSDKVYYIFDYIPKLLTPRPIYDDENNIINNPVDRGEHVNIRVLSKGDVDLESIKSAIVYWYSSFSWDYITINNETKNTYIHTLPNGTEAIVLELKDSDNNITSYQALPQTPHQIFT